MARIKIIYWFIILKSLPESSITIIDFCNYFCIKKLPSSRQRCWLQPRCQLQRGKRWQTLKKMSLHRENQVWSSLGRFLLWDRKWEMGEKMKRKLVGWCFFLNFTLLKWWYMLDQRGCLTVVMEDAFGFLIFSCRNECSYKYIHNGH